MIINWFPGHMNKALKMMEKEVELVDLVIYVLDSRAPFSCLNPSFVSLIKKKKIIYALNKADLVDVKDLEKLKQEFTTENSACITLNSTTSGSSKIVKELMKKLLAGKLEKNKAKGINLPLRAMVIGVPNSGKSTLINNLCGEARAITGNKPGVTKGKQWVKLIDGYEILDTPGSLWPNLEDQAKAKHLAYIGSIKDDVLIIEDLALDFIAELMQKYPLALEERYSIQINEQDEPINVFEKICTARKFLLKRNEPDWERCAKTVLDDFRKGRLGKIYLD